MNEKNESKNKKNDEESVLMNVRLAKLGLKYDDKGFGYADDFYDRAPTWLKDGGCLHGKMIEAMIKRLVRMKRYDDAKNLVHLLEDIAKDYPSAIDSKQLKIWQDEAQEPISTTMLILNIIIMLLVIVNLAMMVTMLFNNGQIPWMMGFIGSLGK